MLTLTWAWQAYPPWTPGQSWRGWGPPLPCPSLWTDAEISPPPPSHSALCDTDTYLGLTGLSTLDPWAELAGVGTSPSLSFSMDGCEDFIPPPPLSPLALCDTDTYLGLTGLSTLDPWAELAGVGTSPSLSFSMDGCGDFTPTPVSLSTMWYWHLPRPDWFIHPRPLSRAGGGGDLSFPVLLYWRMWRFDLPVSLSTMWRTAHTLTTNRTENLRENVIRVRVTYTV